MVNNKIRILDDILISKIAAGEVVERPASVVKELVENSIDAGASKITIDIRGGGRDLIRVTDNGCGMTGDDAKLSLERHSTSKISDADDLFNIRTLGFRGEALPSIASVSKLELTTKPREGGGSSGSRVVSEGGRTKPAADFGCPAGTTVSVANLFFNTPARSKFLKSPGTEFSHIVNIVSKFILSNPEISFLLNSDGEEFMSSPGSGKLADAVASVYGVDMMDTLIEIKRDNDAEIPVWGYISQPVISKSDRGDISIFMNGRYVRNMLLSRALEESYRNVIPANRYPVAVLNLLIDPSKMDVNVHPSKREIKLEKPDIVMAAVRGAAQRALSTLSVPAATLPENDLPFSSRPAVHGGNIPIFDRNIDLMHRPEEQMNNGGYAALTQVADTYIVAVRDGEILLIDQHAAHERILYEKLKGREIKGSQELLINLTIELPAPETAVLKDNLDLVSDLGFELEHFGANSFLIRAIPSVLEYNQAKEAISEVLSDMIEAMKIKDNVKRRDEALKMLACKGAIKAGDKLSFPEMDNLIKDIYRTNLSATCPHGRPTIIKISRSDLEKMFKRK